MARHGENIRKRADGRWEGRYKVFDERRGQFIYRSVYGRDYTETKEKLATVKFDAARRGKEKEPASKTEADDRNCAGGNGGVLFSQAAEEWLTALSCARKHSTFVKYETVYRRYLADIVGSCRLSGDRIRELCEKILDRLSGQEMSESLHKSVICVANQILAFANRYYLTDIPMLERTAVKSRKKTVRIFSEAEQALLFKCVYKQADKFTAAVLLCLCTGLRLGELCALRWTDIDFEEKALTVSRTVQRIAVSKHGTKTALSETSPKSECSERTIPLTSELLRFLSQFKSEHPYVFGGERPLEPRTMQYRFKKILKKAGIETGTFHALRHTFATNCVENGADAKTLSEILGHSDVRISLNRYVHPTMESKRKRIEALFDFYGQICGRAA